MTPPLVGRTHEAGLLSAALDDLVAGRALLAEFDPTVKDPAEAGLHRIEQLAGHGPIVVTADDAQWADSSSLEFLRILAFDDASRLRSAAEQFAGVNRLPDAARAAADAAVAFQRSGNTIESRRLAGVAFQGFDRLGAELLHARLRSDLRDAGLPVRPRRSPARPSNGWESLTPSEATIVGLVGEGLMNGEIADRLFLSRRTVESHLSRVFVKVGVTSRTQLVAASAIRTPR